MISASLRRASGFVIEDFSPRITAGCSRLSLPGTSRQYLPTHFLPTSFTDPDCPLRFDMQRSFRCCRFEATAANGITSLQTCSATIQITLSALGERGGLVAAILCVGSVWFRKPRCTFTPLVVGIQPNGTNCKKHPLNRQCLCGYWKGHFNKVCHPRLSTCPRTASWTASQVVCTLR